ncbi:oligosaccharide repeat unit polymerase [Clostridium sp. chh4-2]|uniref:O-antigen polymerase n=1 Tax=Clostridium sp. chh4-2 TaxID=2067550 RepID=UPI000CCF5ED1|nr:O-antigen polymerase [Clostridium sp. chh4-2]PNV63713.1 oligosaccharide repeat unit polymerase [Clostridium sp. chh4-2]
MIVYLICFVASFILSRSGHYYMSGAALMAAALFLYALDYRRTGNLIHLRALFSLFWVGGQGVSCLKLSSLQTDWAFETWACFFVAFAGFWITFEILDRKKRRYREWITYRNHTMRARAATFDCMVGITVLSLTAFVVEAVVLGYVPFFLRGVPHAYSEFHITGVHYFTVSCVLVPALTVIYFMGERGRVDRKKCAAIWIMTAVSLIIPILCVSRFQLILAVLLAVFTYISIQGRFRLIHGVILVLMMVPLYVMLTIARSHDVTYLNGIFEMKNSSTPIFITQPYMYIANNYENFNCLVEQLPAHSLGLKMLFPVWALTGLKFLIPSLVNFPIYVDKVELTTVTLFYDSYYDFGILGVLLFSCLLGLVAFQLMKALPRMKNPAGYLLYSQIAAYMMLSFFTTWFSNPATWFYLAATAAIALYCSWKGH